MLGWCITVSLRGEVAVGTGYANLGAEGRERLGLGIEMGIGCG